jgi:hypothetical protein
MARQARELTESHDFATTAFRSRIPAKKRPAVLTALVVITAAGVAGLLAGFVLWRAAQLSGLWNLFAGVLLGLAAVLMAILIAYLMVKASPPTP